MSAMDDAKAKAKKILEDIEGTSSRTEVNVETTSESTVTSGSVQADPDDLTADLQRLQAEFINYKRRAEAERADVIDFAKTRVIREFLVVRDSFDQELAHRPATVDPTWATSIDAIRAQFDKVLSDLGVERFESKGQPFDPHLHEAIATDGEGDTVTEELSAGYKLGAAVLRPAMVKVGAPQGDPQ
jgi:molecular chaperone GrpE